MGKSEYNLDCVIKIRPTYGNRWVFVGYYYLIAHKGISIKIIAYFYSSYIEK
ncbi:hypothetical protein BCAH1134_C0123 (plasmid) [Bacillus cereus AH1134]|nr:hypothetical protein BCAH1134_C0123 [Bacillus cereus AH1134]